MSFHVSLVGRKDLGGEIYRQIRQAILDGRLRPGDQLSPSRDLARALTLSRATVTVAYERLAGEGLVTTRPGAGTFVSVFGGNGGREAARKRFESPLRPRDIWESISLPTAFERAVEFDFRAGLPDASSFPHRAWRRFVVRALRSPEHVAGIYADPAGLPDLRAAIARHFSTSRGVDALADDVVITNGTQQALDLVARVLLAPGEKIAVEDPGYIVPTRLFRSLGLRVLGTRVDESGLVVDDLPREVRAVYVTPSHQFPLGVTLTPPRRRALLAWAERTDATIIEDDYDGEFRFGGRPPDPLQILDTKGRVVYVGSFSKTLLPTLRLGFLIAPPSLRSSLQKAKFVSDWHSSTLTQTALAHMIDEGEFARHLRRMNGIYRERHEMLVRAVAREFADHLELIPSTAGLHIAALARTKSAEQIAGVVRRAFDAGVGILTLSMFAVSETPRAGVLFGYGAIGAERIPEGLRRLRECFEA
jgi:GntR family transcriptional regulator/MocR family aminotransferase